MELELKHIQHYELSGDNGLKFKHENNTEPIQLDSILLKCEWNFTFTDNKGNADVGLFSQIKPLLLPMSSLYTEMEDGTVPIVEIYKNMFVFPRIKEYKIEDGCLKFDKHTFEWVDEFRAFSLDGDTAYITIEVSDYLDENHFDWRYGLIDKGLALDKTKIK
ncbi:hypothetical protein [Dysgonomonas sp.]|uniref:hypothetical protein n=1 Tax=Dysgonomonas sp. TaxID=1891233 RepID=UPI0027B9C7CD|nr:hypothetical protein [Dysgonomonas sp.]